MSMLKGFRLCLTILLIAVACGSVRAQPITVDYPNGGESFCTGWLVGILWTCPPPADSVSICLYSGSSLVDTISPGTANDGSYPWTIPGNLSTGTQFRVRIRALQGPGDDYSNGTFNITAVLPQVTGVTASDTGCSSVQVNWNDLNGEQGYVVLRNHTFVDSLPANTTTYTDVPPPGTYSYTVRAFNICGLGLESQANSGTRRSTPSEVTGVTASSNLCNAVRVTWTDVSNETVYRVYRDGILRDSTRADSTQYTDTTAVPGRVYDYAIIACNSQCCGPQSLPAGGMRRRVPVQVTGLWASDSRCDSVVIQWEDVDDDTGYRVFRNGILISTTPVNAARATDAPADTVRHAYTVQALNPCGYGLMSDSAYGRRLPLPLPPTGLTASDSQCGHIEIGWQYGSAPVEGVYVFRNNVRIDTVMYPIATAADVPPRGTYNYYVRAFRNDPGCGMSAASNSDSGRIFVGPFPPTNLIATTNLCDRINLSWHDSPGTVMYCVYRDDFFIANTSTPSYADMAVPADTALYYVTAEDGVCPPSAHSNEVRGSVQTLCRISTSLPQSLRCRSWVRLTFSHCANVGPDSVLCSIRFHLSDPEVFSTIASYASVVDSDSVEIPSNGTAPLTPYCRLAVVSSGYNRTDWYYSNYFAVTCGLTDDEPDWAATPRDFFLDQNFPNPFNATTTIRFGVPHAATVTIEVYDVLGRKAASLVSSSMQPGVHAVVWDGLLSPTGMYFVRMHAEERVVLRKMLLMK